MEHSQSAQQWVRVLGAVRSRVRPSRPQAGHTIGQELAPSRGCGAKAKTSGQRRPDHFRSGITQLEVELQLHVSTYCAPAVGEVVPCAAPAAAAWLTPRPHPCAAPAAAAGSSGRQSHPAAPAADCAAGRVLRGCSDDRRRCSGRRQRSGRGCQPRAAECLDCPWHRRRSAAAAAPCSSPWAAPSASGRATPAGWGPGPGRACGASPRPCSADGYCRPFSWAQVDRAAFIVSVGCCWPIAEQLSMSGATRHACGRGSIVVTVAATPANWD